MELRTLHNGINLQIFAVARPKPLILNFAENDDTSLRRAIAYASVLLFGLAWQKACRVIPGAERG